MKLETLVAQRPAKTVYKSDEFAIKLFNEDFSKADILNEALNLARVEETGLPIPKVDEVTKIDGKWAIVTKYIEGKTIRELMNEHPERENAYLERFVNIQLEMHEKTAPLLSKLKDKMNRKISSADLDATTRYELHTRLERMPKHTKLCHGDYNLENVILSADESQYYIIDWAHATQGNASADAARTYLLFNLAGDTDRAERYLNLFCQKSDTAKQYVQQWLPIVAASQSVKGKTEEREFLLNWVNVVEYE